MPVYYHIKKDGVESFAYTWLDEMPVIENPDFIVMNYRYKGGYIMTAIYIDIILLIKFVTEKLIS